MQLFYIPEISGKNIILNVEESRHAVKVLRLKAGESIHIVDGKGGFYQAEISDPNPKKCGIIIKRTEQNYGKRNFYLHIAIAPTKNIDRFEWFLEKCTEIGIDEITPILTENSERKVIKPERLQKILVSAMKQSLKATLPKLNPLTRFQQFVEEAPIQAAYIAHCNESEKTHLKKLVKKNADVLVLIGPEGDFSLQEVALAKDNGYTEISLGDARLRTETAGIVACHIVNLANE